MDTANPILKTRETMIRVFRGFPIAMLITITLLGSFQGNINLLIFAVGLGILAPLTALIFNVGIDLVAFLLTKLLGDDGFREAIRSALSGRHEVCGLFDTANFSSAPTTPFNFSSYWAWMSSFFIVYLILNAHDLYTRETPKSADPIAVKARKTRALMSIVFLSVALFLLLLIRSSVMVCEPWYMIAIYAGLGGGVATGWYKFVRNCGLGHFDDIFGISGRLLSKEASGIKSPKMCLPIAPDAKKPATAPA